VDLKPSEMLGAILNGDIDAAFTWDPNAYKMKEELGDNAISWPGEQDFYFVLIAKEEWVENNPVAAERFMESLLEAEAYVKDNSDEAKEFIKDIFACEADYMDYSWPEQEFTVILEQAMLVTFEDQARWAIENKLADETTVPNYLDFIYIAALEAVRPEAVTIIR
jgi:NitT/TauT family transport system substrate-binding protein